jgi:hypothetical protein
MPAALRPLVAAGAVGAVAVLPVACSARAADPPPPPDLDAVVAAITEAGLRDRLAGLASATGESAPFRAVGSPGFDRAATFVEEQLESAGWTVHPQAYDADTVVGDGRSSLEVAGARHGEDEVRPLVFAPPGDVTGPVVAVGEWARASGRTGSGCAVGDYRELPPDAVVLVLPGPCFRRDQVLAAQQAGAAAFVTSSPGIPAGILLRPTLVEPDGLTIPAAWAAPPVTDALTTVAERGGRAHLVTTALVEQAPTRSVIAELPGRQGGPVVMVGAHLDSVLDGPGINDDGSGVATLLELARALGGRHPEATVRLAFWSGEEMGLHGSSHYVAGLSAEERESLLVYVNVDMVGSPNGFAGVYEEPDAPEGSAIAAELLRAAVERAGATPVGVDLHGRSDHYGFADVAVPTAGLFSGALEPVTEDQAAASDATAGRPADPCYHQACDDVDNVDLPLARVLAAALADFTVRVAEEPALLGWAAPGEGAP